MKNVKRILLIIILLSAGFVNGQPPRQTKENVEAMKIGFITERLQLSPQEAQTFWPVYNQYHNELDKLRSSRREIMRDARENKDEMSDADAEKFVDGEIAFRQNELDILKKYHPQFKKILSAKQVAKLYRAEEDFKRRLLEKLQEKKDGQGPGPKPKQ